MLILEVLSMTLFALVMIAALALMIGRIAGKPTPGRK